MEKKTFYGLIQRLSHFMPHAVTREATPLDLFTSSFPPKADSLPLYAWMYVLLMEYTFYGPCTN